VASGGLWGRLCHRPWHHPALCLRLVWILKPIALIAAVNESVWEHLKLGFWPAFLYSLFAYRGLSRPAESVLVARTAAMILIPVIITVAYYTYLSLAGRHSLVVDIGIFVVAVLLGQLTSYLMLSSPNLPQKLIRVAPMLLAASFIAFSLFTYYAPHLPLFRDPRSGRYGLVAHAGGK
jgi:hypothetical protein